MQVCLQVNRAPRLEILYPIHWGLCSIYVLGLRVLAAQSMLITLKGAIQWNLNLTFPFFYPFGLNESHCVCFAFPTEVDSGFSWPPIFTFNSCDSFLEKCSSGKFISPVCIFLMSPWQGCGQKSPATVLSYARGPESQRPESTCTSWRNEVATSQLVLLRGWITVRF